MNHPMNWPRKRISSQSGVGMIEVLVSLVILMVGLLGLAGLMMHSQSSEMESYQRVQALILLQDMAGRLNANRNVASCYNITTAFADGTPYVGEGTTATACGTGTTEQKAQYLKDMDSWREALKGAGETSGGSKVGAMIGARGCISYNGATANLVKDKNGVDIAGTGVYTIAVSWQGISNTFAPAPLSTPALSCGKGQYGSENLRRIVSLTIRIGAINNTI